MTGQRERNGLLLLVGAFAVWLGARDVALDYVRPQVRVLVVAAGAVLVLLAVLPPAGFLGRAAPVAGDHDDHGRVGVGWLLVVPAVVLALVAPSPLGANAVHSRLVRPSAGRGTYPPVASPVDGAVPMSMAEFYSRALRDEGRSLRDVRVRLVGFVSGTRAGGDLTVSRFVIYCCAADAEAVEVVVRGARGTFPRNSWVRLEGTWQPTPFDDTSYAPPVLLAASAIKVKVPHPPYEYTATWVN